jgi:hypothetical protein
MGVYVVRSAPRPRVVSACLLRCSRACVRILKDGIADLVVTTAGEALKLLEQGNGVGAVPPCWRSALPRRARPHACGQVRRVAETYMNARRCVWCARLGVVMRVCSLLTVAMGCAALVRTAASR